MSDRVSNAATASGDEDPIGLRGYLNVVGVAGIATMTAVGPASIAAYLRGGALLGPQMGWVVLMASLTMWVVLNMSNRTTCMTGKPPLQLLAEIWKPLALIGFFLWVVPQVFIVMVQGGALAQTASALTAVPAQFVVWPTLILVGVVFFAGTFKFVRSIAALLLTLLMITGLALAVRLLVGGELPMKDAFEGLIVPKWPGEGETTALVAGAIGGAGSWGFLAYQGYSVFGSRNARPERLRLVNLDAAVLGFGLFFLFSIGIFWAASGTFYGGDAPETAIDAADLFVPQLGEWVTVYILGRISWRVANDRGWNSHHISYQSLRCARRIRHRGRALSAANEQPCIQTEPLGRAHLCRGRRGYSWSGEYPSGVGVVTRSLGGCVASSSPALVVFDEFSAICRK